MGWKLTTAADEDRIEAILREREWQCMAFSSRYRHQQIGGNSEKVSVFAEKTHRRYTGNLICLTAHGLVVPCFHNTPDDIPALKRLINSPFRPIDMIMGTSQWVGLLQDQINRRARTVIDYDAMIQTRCVPPLVTPAHCRIRPPESGDLPALLELQKAYELEEVLLDSDRFNAGLSRRMLEKTLRENIVLVLEREGRLEAKANTNGRGFAFDQIGGVFTRPESRGCGYSTLLIGELTARIAGDGKQACLFVKPENHAAVRVYTKTGFVKQDTFRICYYR